MKPITYKLPSNRHFGIFCGVVTLAASFYSLIIGSVIAGIVCGTMAFIFALIVVIKDELLHPLNVGWAKLGEVLGRIISPIVLGCIFFGLITPVGLITKAFGRDELRVRGGVKTSYWIDREFVEESQCSFERQF